MKREAWLYENGAFTHPAVEVEVPDDSGEDWTDTMQHAGWKYMGHFPDHSGFEGATLDFTLYRREGECLAEVVLRDTEIAVLLCRNTPDLLSLLRDWIYPLTAFGNFDLIGELASEMAIQQSIEKSRRELPRRQPK